tara:strand:+ start:435 stop:740 length:306 start_codon:yes stop_codon:yes gene_type:complete
MVRFPYAVAKNSFDATKAPGEKLPYNINWSDMLAAGESITTSAWTVSDSDMTLSDPSISGLETTTKAQGGRAGYNYVLTNTINTSNANICVRRFNIRVKQK